MHLPSRPAYPYIFPRSLIAATALALASAARGAAADVAAPDDTAVVILERGPDHLMAEHVVTGLDEDGRPIAVTNRFTQLETGLHVKGPAGEWVPASDEIIIEADGLAAAHHIARPVSFTANLNQAGAVGLAVDAGRTLRFHVAGIGFRDDATGASVIIAQSRDSQGLVIGRNQVWYADAFEGLEADVLYTVTRSSLEQFVILREAGPSPADFGLDPETTHLEVFTEFMEPPEPVQREGEVRASFGEARRRQLDRTALADVSLDFGPVHIGPGTAFHAEDFLGVGAAGGGASPVAKEWLQEAGRTFLVEAVEFAAVEPTLARLPKPREARRRLEPGQPGAARSLPARPAAYASKSRANDRSVLRMAAAPPARPGYVVDWTAVTTSTTGYLFRSDMTYKVSGPVNLSGPAATPVVFEGGTVIKYDPGVGANISIQAGTVLKFQGQPYRPVVLTARDDNTQGATVSGSTGTPSGYYAGTALTLNAAGQVNFGFAIRNFRICHALLGVHAYYASSTQPDALRFVHGQLVNCGGGLRVDYGVAKVLNVLMSGVGTNFHNCYAGTITVQHLTAANAAHFMFNPMAGSTISLMNSLLANVASTANVTIPANSAAVSGSGIFQAVGAGYHYLPESSPHRNAGTVLDYVDSEVYHPMEAYDAINPSSTSTRVLTTQAPIVWTSLVNQSATLHRRNLGVIRSLDTLLDRGYHYWQLDYAFSGPDVTGATLLLTNGVAVAFYGSKGIGLKNGATVLGGGMPGTKMNRLVRYNCVQEQPVAWGTPTSSARMFDMIGNATTKLDLRFTEVSLLAEPTARRLLVSSGSYYGTVRLRDCWLRNLSLSAYGSLWSPTLILYNNVWERCDNSLAQGVDGNPYLTLDYRHNFIRGGRHSFTFTHPAYSTWHVRDNLFHAGPAGSLTATTPDSSRFSHNGFTQGTAALPGANNATGLTPAFVDETAGSYHYVTGSPMAAALVNHGSRSCRDAGLYHFTAFLPSANKHEGADTSSEVVDIGFHFADERDVDGVTSDGGVVADGLANWIEDADGDGIWDSGIETRWQSVDLDGDGGSNPDTDWNEHGADTDGDYLSDALELEFGSNPFVVNTDGDAALDEGEHFFGTNPQQGPYQAPKRLGYWRFHTPAFTEELGLQPVAAGGVGSRDSFEGKAAHFPAASSSVLAYPRFRSVSDPASRTLDLGNGTVRFWYLPDWYHGNKTDSAGSTVCLLDTGSWRLIISTDGRSLILGQPDPGNPSQLGTIYLKVFLPRGGDSIGNPPTTIKAFEISLSYGPVRSMVTINGLVAENHLVLVRGAPAYGSGVPPEPAAGMHPNFLIGNASTGGQAAQGRMDEFETFNTTLPTLPGKHFISCAWDTEARRTDFFSAIYQASPPGIQLRWLRGFEGDWLQAPDGYKIERRVHPAGSWADLAVGAVRADNHLDQQDLVAGTTYEYRLKRQNLQARPTALAAVPPTSGPSSPGLAIILVETAMQVPLAPELTTLAADLATEGWEVRGPHAMPRQRDSDWYTTGNAQFKADVQTVRNKIIAEKNAAP